MDPRQWRDRLVRRREEGTVRRRPGDAVRVVVAAVAVVLLAFHADHPTRLEHDVVRLVDGLPHGGHSFVVLAYNLLTLWAIGLLFGAAVLVRRWRLVRDVALAGVVAWVLGGLVARMTHDAGVWSSLHLTLDLTDLPRYPAVRLGVAVAMVVVAAPHLTRPVRRIGQVLVGLIAIGALYLGRAAPTDLVLALVLGWGVAALVRYAFGTPDGRPTAADVAAGLAQLGIPVATVVERPHQRVGRAEFLAHGADGDLRVAALGRDEADAQLVARAGRAVMLKDAPQAVLLTRHQQVVHEAYVQLLVAEAGAHVPAVVRAANAGPLALLVEREVAGVPLFDADPDTITDAVLDDAWRQVRALRAVRVAHGKLDGHYLLVDGERTVLTGFEWSTTEPGFQAEAADVAELLAATGAVVGPERATAAAIRGVGTDAVRAALPRLQPVAISGWTHDAYGGRAGLDDQLAALRSVAATAVGIEAPQLRGLYRVQPRSLVMAVAALFAVGFLLSRVGDPAVFWEQIRTASWGYVGVALVLGILTDVAFGITFLGNVPIRIPIWPSVELQSAMSFSNLAVPVAADTAMQVRFLQKQGLDLPSAVATGGVLSTVSEIVVQVGLLFVALWLAPDTIDFGRIDTAQIVVVVLGVVLLLGVASAVVLGVRRIRHRVLPGVRQAAATVWAAVRTPSRLALLVAGNVVAQCLYAGSLLACLAAFGAHVDFWTLLALNIGISTIASLVPLPGGSTAVSAVGMAGMLTAFGVPHAAASAAVLAHQVAVTYLPAIPGWFATNDLVKKGML
jgi:undecaprenyl-diphosphatase